MAVPCFLWCLVTTRKYQGILFVNTAIQLYVILSRFNATSPEQNMDAEIRNTLAGCASLTDEAKYFLYGLMRTNTKLRSDFDTIPSDPWIANNPA